MTWGTEEYEESRQIVHHSRGCLIALFSRYAENKTDSPQPDYPERFHPDKNASKGKGSTGAENLLIDSIPF